MKKVIAIMMALVITFSVAACAVSEVAGPSSKSPDYVATAAPPSTSVQTPANSPMEMPASDSNADTSIATSSRPEPVELTRDSYDGSITFENLARNPDKYKGSLVVMYGTVLQVQELVGEIQIRLAVNGDLSQTVYVYFSDKLLDERILDNDALTIYGEAKGLHTYTTVLGASVTLPLISANIVDFGVTGITATEGGDNTSSSTSPEADGEDTFSAYLSANDITLTNTDVEVDNAAYLDALFSLKGTAELSDYFNYGYDNSIESTYFSIRVRSNDGKSWYIYAERTEFSDLFSRLKEGSAIVSFVCFIDSARFKSSQKEMATLNFAQYPKSSTGASSGNVQNQNSFELYLSDNNVSLSAIDVQYDMANNVGNPFSITGTASLNDYYNYGYNDKIIGSYFCVKVKPNNGDSWYIYADRSQYSSLFQTLLNGETSISAVCFVDPSFYKSGMNPMASLKYAEFVASTYTYDKKGSASFKEFVASCSVELSAAQVHYDMTNQVGNLFMLEGVAEISDYYNYGYRNTDAQYFCMSVTPTDNSGKWYIYCDRSIFPDLFDALKKGKVDISSLCYIDSARYNSAQNPMATLHYVE